MSADIFASDADLPLFPEDSKAKKEKQTLEELMAKDKLVEPAGQTISQSAQAESDNLPEIELEELGGTQSLEDQIQIKILEEEMQRSYLSYAMSVIVSRALPDVRDGLKPVHRRILYAMHKLNLTPGAKYVKCARIVGDVIGKYHPHGDQSVYNALVRLAQDFSMRYPLIDGQGNFGSVDGDEAAAYRYTEARMARPAVFMLADLDKDTVDFVDNFDGTQKEPRVLPTIFPNLLVNGQTGIAVGMATEIPPHNLGEVVQALIHLLDFPEADVDTLTEFIKGPDLPTGAIIFGRQDLLAAYKTGRGKVTVRARAVLEDNRIVVTEIPFQVNKSDLLVRIAELVKDKKLEGIKDVRDESNKEGIRIVIETKRDVSPEILLNQLYALTDLQSTIHFNMVALVNEGRQPKLLNLKDILTEFLGHRDQVVIRRTNFELRQAEAELHILEGLKIALDHIDEVITLIRSSFDKTEAAAKLQARFALSAKQAEAILQMRLQTLTNLDKTKIEEQRQKTIALIERLKNILYDPEVKKALIKQEFLDMLQKFDTSRRTEIVEYDASSYNKEDLVENVPMLLQFTQAQYIKALPLDTFKQQGRGGRGVSSFSPREEDWVRKSLVCQAHDYMLAFTNTGRVFKIRVFDLPSGSRTSRGQSLVNYLNLQPDEKITTVFTISKELEASSQGALIFATKKGKVKKTWLHEFKNVRSTGKVAITLEPKDVLIDVVLSQSESDKIILSANNGKTVIFPVDQLSALGRTAQGVIGMRLKPDEEVISLQISDFDFQVSSSEEEPEALLELAESKKNKTFPSLLVITENGFGKQTDLAEFRQTNRGASGVKTLKLTEKTGRPVAVQILHGHETSLIVTTKNGVTIRLDPNEINQFGRVTQGVKLIKLDDSDRVVTASVI